tara:strand:+ start:55523 stop:57928 length:2406 start_codon:yes stop_codon:yes gene_type:complete
MQINKYPTATIFGVYILFLLFLLFNSTQLVAQTITIQDQQTLEPIPFANISSYQLLITETANGFVTDSVRVGTTTDINGHADISDWSDDMLLHISFLGYEKRKITKGEILKKNNVIFLRETAQFLEQVVISASKFREKREDVAYSIESLDRKTIENANVTQTPDLLTKTNGVTIQKSQLGGGSPIIRGFEANRVLLVVDGVRMNNAIYRSGHLQNSLTIDPNAVEIVEVVFGPSSTIYGSDALGGVIHFYTRKPQFSKNDKIFTQTKVVSRMSLADEGMSTHIDYNIGGKNVANFTSLTYTSFGDLRMGQNRNHGYDDWGLANYYINENDEMVENENSHIQVGTGYEQYDLLNNLTWKATPEIILRWNTQLSTTTNIPRYDNLQDYNDGELKWSEWHYGPQTRFFTSLQGNVYKQTKFYDNFRVTSAYQFIKEDRITRKYQSEDYNNTYVDVHVSSINFDLSKKKLLYGFEFVNNQVISTSTAGTQPRYPSGGSDLTSIAAYTTYKHHFSEKFLIAGGLRYSSIFANMSFNNDDPVFVTDEINATNGALTGNINSVWKPGNGWKFDVVGSTGFRSPNIDDYGKVFVKRGDMVIPNPDLTPEYAYNTEGTLTKTWSNISLAGTIYNTWLRDAITKQDLGYSQIHEDEEVNVQTLMNTEEAYVRGISLVGKYEPVEELYFESSFNLQKGYDISNDEPLGHIPPAYGKFLTRFKLKKFEGRVWYDYALPKLLENSNGATDNIDLATDEGWPFWYTLNLSMTYNINKGLTMQIGLENLMDLHYRTFASGLSAPGRNVIIKAQYKF